MRHLLIMICAVVVAAAMTGQARTIASASAPSAANSASTCDGAKNPNACTRPARTFCSPRASIGIDRAARAHAWLNGRDFVGPEDIQAVIFDVLRHRLVLSFEAEADGVDANSVIERILDGVGVP